MDSSSIFVGVKHGIVQYLSVFGDKQIFTTQFFLFGVSSAKETTKVSVYRQLTPGAFSRLDLNDIMHLKTEVVTCWTSLFVQG